MCANRVMRKVHKKSVEDGGQSFDAVDRRQSWRGQR